jgi:MFS family permease
MEYELIPDEVPRSNSNCNAAADAPFAQILLLAVTSVLSFGSHFGRHFLSSLGPAIMTRLSITRTEFGLTFSIQEVPGVCVPILGSVLISAAHVRLGPAAVVLASVLSLGQVLTAVAIHLRSYQSLLLGRLLFGLGDGCLVVVQGAIVGERFKHGGKLSLAFGTMILSSRLSSYAGLVSPKFLSDSLGLVPSTYLSSSACCLSLLAAAVYAYFLDSSVGNSSVSNAESEATPSFIRQVWETVRKFRLPFWLVACCWGMLASAVFTPLHFASDIALTSPVAALSARQNISGLVSGGILLLSAFVSPIAGFAQDRVGRRVSILFSACSITSVGLLVCAYGVQSNAVLVLAGLTLIAIGFAAAPVTLLSCVAICVDREQLPAALGLYKASENVVMSQAHWVAGALRDKSQTYFWTLAFLSGLAGLGSAAASALSRSNMAEALAETSSSAVKVNRGTLTPDVPLNT